MKKLRRLLFWIPTLGLLAPLYAVDLKTIEADCTYNQYFAATSVATSTHAVIGMGLSYAIRAAGSDASYHVAHTTRTYSDRTIVVSSVTTPEITVPAGTSASFDFRALTINPQVVLSGLSTSATAYVYIDYCEPKKQ